MQHPDSGNFSVSVLRIYALTWIGVKRVGNGRWWRRFRKEKGVAALIVLSTIELTSKVWLERRISRCKSTSTKEKHKQNDGCKSARTLPWFCELLYFSSATKSEFLQSVAQPDCAAAALRRCLIFARNMRYQQMCCALSVHLNWDRSLITVTGGQLFTILVTTHSSGITHSVTLST